jgi:hypothetical protein
MDNQWPLAHMELRGKRTGSDTRVTGTPPQPQNDAGDVRRPFASQLEPACLALGDVEAVKKSLVFGHGPFFFVLLKHECHML